MNKSVKTNDNKTSVAGTGMEDDINLDDMLPTREIEKAIIKKHRKRLWSPFVKAIKEYELLKDGDRVAVAISGGKDSLLLAKLFQELKRHRQIDFELEFIAMDPGYHQSVREVLIANCEGLGIPVHIYKSEIFRIVDDIANDYPCYMCAKMRRGSLYDKAESLGCNKLALGHHFDDVIETTLMNLFYAGTVKTMLPKLKSKNFKNMELIRPMYLIRESSIQSFTKACGIQALDCACVVAAKKTSNMRYEMKALLNNMSWDKKIVEKSIFKALHNINLDSSIGWVKDGKRHSYLDEYNLD